ncbi:uncharacterized protein VTP21DRAFT_3362 [Calcarisporiella thermophila]|uniref:uncharacterized protein n=1 Tax=Calcarisporiella thermophila TaxID=911321 RepID=UPI003743DD00
MGKRKSYEQNPDLCQLNSHTEDDIVSNLRERFQQDAVYTALSDVALVVVNPYKDLPGLLDSASQDYVADYKDTSGQRNELPPHIFKLTSHAYLHMRRTGLDQAIILSGESGSGKSKTFNHILHHLGALSTGHKKPSKIPGHVVNSAFVLESFGNAKTIINDGASRFGRYVEVLFNERGRMVGAKTLDYLLERSRVVSVPLHERNFNVFYYLLAGSSPDEQSHLQLGDASTFRYTSMGQLTHVPSIDDAENFGQLRTAMKSCGFRSKQIFQVMQLLAAILHLGNLIFFDVSSNTQESAQIKNVETLSIAADLLGLETKALETVLTYKTEMIKKDVTTVFLNAEQAAAHRDSLAKALYSLLFSWIVEQINVKFCRDEFASFIGIVDLPGFQSHEKNLFDQFCVNFANERLHSIVRQHLFNVGEFEQDGVQSVAKVPYTDNSECLEMLSNGIVKVMDEQFSGKGPKTDSALVEAFDKTCTSYSTYISNISKRTYTQTSHSFSVRHFAGQVNYTIDGFTEMNLDMLGGDFIALFRGGSDIKPTSNSFISELFRGKALATQAHPRNENTIVSAQQSAAPTRAPSMRRPKKKEGTNEGGADAQDKPTMRCVATQLRGALDDLATTLSETTNWLVFCIRPNNNGQPNMFDAKKVKSQVRVLGLVDIAKRLKVNYTISFTHAEFFERYSPVLNPLGIEQNRSLREKCEAARTIFGWAADAMAVGNAKVFLNEKSWRDLEDNLRNIDKDEQRRAKEDKLDKEGEYLSETTGHPRQEGGAVSDGRSLYTGEDVQSYLSEEEFYPDRYNDNESNYGSDMYVSLGFNEMEMKTMLADGQPPPDETLEEVAEMSGARKRWLALVWFLTWPFSNYCLVSCGKKRPDIQIAWREKVALCILIFFICALQLFFIIGLDKIICPKQNVFSPNELQFPSDSSEKFTAIRGEVFDLGRFAPNHWAPSLIPQKEVLNFAGKDASDIFPVQVSALCQGVTGSVDDSVPLDANLNYTNPIARYHDFRYFTEDFRRDWYWNQMEMMRKKYRVGYMAYSMDAIRDQAIDPNKLRRWAVIDNAVYDMTEYIKGGRKNRAPPGQTAPIGETEFMHIKVTELFQKSAGEDVTKYFDSLPLPDREKLWQRVCLRNLFFVGVVDNRSSARCLFGTYLLLAISLMMVSIIIFKFLAALQLGSRREPEEHDRFIICQVPCYTEGEESLRKTIDSLAALRYDDKRKLLFIICDGMIIGSGNDRPTPRIVLDILGVDPNVDPEPLSFQSLGEGAKQHNMGKVYSGLYECNGHVVPYIVVVKVGKPTERQRPGNRGKRDSQMILMRFLNKVHYNKEMAPLELEVYHQMKNVIGVNPSFYEFILMVDADTEVLPDSLNRLVSTFVHDTRVIGLCGETMLSNERDSWVTMIQVYEYYISHHLSKAFESLFGSVTCLPGCFCMYRIRTPEKQQPLIVSNEMIDDYGENSVDTLHKKNLLHLGEDRYLTTLMMKHFPMFKLRFIPDAQCRTNAPDRWSVLLSQRRRWINSTIHNLAELMFLPHLCGFCCFSMRFVVFVDLFATLIMPAMVIYLVYLVVLAATSKGFVVMTSLIMLAAVYGLQAIIFLLRRKWEHIGWMIFYIFAIPVFSFYIPLYSFWHFDDFSWGNTRVVVGEKGKKFVVTDEGKFDPREIPLRKWSDYEQDMWEVGTAASHESGGTQVSYRTRGYSGSKRGSRSMAGSVIGDEEHYAASQMGIPSPAMAMGAMHRNSVASAGRSRSRSPGPAAGLEADRMSMASYHQLPQHLFFPDMASQRGSMMLDRSAGMGVPSELDYNGGTGAGSTRPLSGMQLSLIDGYMGQQQQQQPLPSDDAIVEQIRRIISSSDLMSITKKQVREELSAYFGVDMTPKKEYINNCIELILQGKL